MLDFFLPVAEVGPWDSCALARLAANWISEMCILVVVALGAGCAPVVLNKKGAVRAPEREFFSLA